MTACHLIARLKLALRRDEDFDHLHHARRQLITSLQLLDFVLKAALQRIDRLVVLLLQGFQLVIDASVLDDDLAPLARRKFGKKVLRYALAVGEPLRSASYRLVHQTVFQTFVVGPFENSLLVVTVLRQPLNLRPFDGQGALIFLDAAAREHANFNDSTLDPRRHFQRGIADVGCFFAEDRPEQFLLRRHRRFAFRRHFADKNVARIDFRTDIHDAGFIQILQRFFTHVRDVARDFFLT